MKKILRVALLMLIVSRGWSGDIETTNTSLQYLDKVVAIDCSKSIQNNLSSIADQSGVLFCTGTTPKSKERFYKPCLLKTKTAKISDFIKYLKDAGFCVWQYESSILVCTPEMYSVAKELFEYEIKQFRFSGTYYDLFGAVGNMFPDNKTPSIVSSKSPDFLKKVNLEITSPMSTKDLLMKATEKTRTTWRICFRPEMINVKSELYSGSLLILSCGSRAKK